MTDLPTVLKALADPNRLRLLTAIDTHGELCACQLTELLGVTGATCSQHLSQLVKAGLLKRRRAGRWMHFSRDEATLAPELASIATQIIQAFGADPAWETASQRLTRILSVTPQDLCLSQRG